MIYSAKNSYSSPEQALWAAVVLAVINDLLTKSPHGFADRKRAESWVSSYKTPDFKMVCALAGLDPEAAHDQLLAICSTPHKERDLESFMRRNVCVNPNNQINNNSLCSS